MEFTELEDIDKIIAQSHAVKQNTFVQGTRNSTYPKNHNKGGRLKGFEARLINDQYSYDYYITRKSENFIRDLTYNEKPLKELISEINVLVDDCITQSKKIRTANTLDYINNKDYSFSKKKKSKSENMLRKKSKKKVRVKK